MTRLVLVRHGEAQSAVDGIIGGERACTGLSDLGRRQAAALRDRLKTTGELGTVDALYASTLPRASETAEILAPAFGDIGVRRERDLREFDPGDADGMAWEDYTARYPPPDVWNPHVPRTPNSESWADFSDRVERAVSNLVAAHSGETVVVVCHGGVIECTFHLWGVSPLPGLHIDIDNTAITEFHWTEPWPWHLPNPPGWRLVRHNDRAHLLDVV